MGDVLAEASVHGVGGDSGEDASGAANRVRDADAEAGGKEERGSGDLFGSIREKVFTWAFVRNIGELQILTRASYAMLIAVPLLAGAWPTVRVLVSSHNKVLDQATMRLDAVAQDVAGQMDVLQRWSRTVVEQNAPDVNTRGLTARIAESATHIQDLSRTIETELKRLRQQAALSPFMPSSWALAFFAALSVALGHLVYQMRAPFIVRRDSPEDFVRRSLQEYRDGGRSGRVLEGWKDEFYREAAEGRKRKPNRTEAERLAIELAKVAYKEENDFRILHESEKERLRRLHEQLSEHLKHLKKHEVSEIYEQAEEEFRKTLGGSMTSDFLKRFIFPAFPESCRAMSKDDVTVAYIDEAASLKYRRESRRNLAAMGVALALYTMAGLIVFCITLMQSWAVVGAVGWFPLGGQSGPVP